MFRVEKYRKIVNLKINGDSRRRKKFSIVLRTNVRLKARSKFDPLNAAEIIQRVVFEDWFATETFEPQNLINCEDFGLRFTKLLNEYSLLLEFFTENNVKGKEVLEPWWIYPLWPKTRKHQTQNICILVKSWTKWILKWNRSAAEILNRKTNESYIKKKIGGCLSVKNT